MSFNWDIPNEIPHYTGALSILGSGCIIVHILLDRERLRKPYFRILLALSAYDILSSGWFFAAKWAASTQGPTCEASGFFTQLGATAIPLYNVALSTQYYLSLKEGWDEARIWRAFERPAHVIINVLAIALAVLPLPLELYNPWYFYCYLSAALLPDGWRGDEDHMQALLAVFWAVVYASALAIIVLMGGIVHRVHKLNATLLHQHDAATARSEGEAEQEAEGRERLEREARVRNKDVRTMAFLYTVPFCLTWVVPSSIMLRHQLLWRGKPMFFNFPLRTTYASMIYISVALPLQGFFNGVVYAYSRFLGKRRGREAEGEGAVAGDEESGKKTVAPARAWATTNMTLSQVGESQVGESQVGDLDPGGVEMSTLSSVPQATAE